jgi:RHS repeat-associated protein
MLSTVTWTGAGDGVNYTDPHNWSTQAIPGPGDDAVINTSGAAITLNGTETVRSLNTVRAFTVAGGSLTVAGGTGAPTTVIGSAFTIASAATMNVMPGVPVTLAGNQTLTDNGSLTFATGDTFTLTASGYGPTQLLVSGTLTASGASFTQTNSGYQDNLIVYSGGHLTANSSSFAINQMTLSSGVIFNPGDLANNSFYMPLFLPATDVALLSAAGGGSDNKQFQYIEILNSTLAGGTVNLNAIGTVSTSSLRYVFPYGFTIASGATINAGAGVLVELGGDQTFTDNGTMTLATGDTVSFDASGYGPTQLLVSGTLTASGASFTQTNSGYQDNLIVYSGGQLFASNTAFRLNQIILNTNSTSFFDANSAGESVNFGGGSGQTLTNFSAITAENGATIVVPESMQVNGSSILTVSANSSLVVNGNLLGNTQYTAAFNQAGTVTLNGAGTATSPELLEAMSADLGGTSTSFVNNFAYGTLALAGNTYVKLVDQSHNTTSTSPEAVYTNSLYVPAGATLNLNGLNLYVRDSFVAGTVVGGTINHIPNAGPIAVGYPTPGNLSGGVLDQWSFFGTAGASITAAIDPGSGSLGGPVSPTLQWAELQFQNSAGVIVASTSDTAAGGVLALTNIVLPVSGTYYIDVTAPASHVTSSGNYVLAAYNVTPNIQTLNVNQTTAGAVVNPYSVEQWTFSATANTQVQFNLLGSSAGALNFSLSGPGGFTGFTGISGNSNLVTLPTSGTYTLTAQGTGGAVGSFSFSLNQTNQIPLTLDTPMTGVFAGTGQAQLFQFAVPTASPLLLSVTDNNTTDHTELYASFGSPPTRETYQYGANGAGSSQSLIVPSGAAGTWYILVYAESVTNAPSSFTLEAVAAPVFVSSVTPVQYGANALATLTLNGAGFAPSSTVTLIAAASSNTYEASNVTFDTNTELTVSINLASVPQGVYSIQVSGPTGTGTLPSGFTVTAPGVAQFETHLILPAAIGRHISSTFYIEYSNTGTAAMPAPIVLLESKVPDDLPLFTLEEEYVVSGYWTSATPQHYATIAQILATGKTPGVLEPGESVTVPVYYAGMLQPWVLSEAKFYFDLRVFNTTDTDAVNWSSLQSSLQPAGISNAAWNTVYSNLTSQLGNTWGSYVQLLDNEAGYLDGLGEQVTDVNSLWDFAVQQADNALNPIGPSLTSATDDSVATPGTLSLSFSRLFASSIIPRYTLGPLGYGWSTPWQTTASNASDGTVTIFGAGGAQRVFQPDSRTAGVYFSSPGDTGTLSADGSHGYLLTESNGTATDYNANGTLNYLRDTNGNTITAGYTSGRLTSLTASSGQSITIGYNAAGRISTVSDSQGRVNHYYYDSTNQYLTSVTSFNGQTTYYSYNTGAGPSQNTLASITYPGNTHEYFGYDGLGRLDSTSNDGGAQPQTYSYNLGEVSVTDATSDTSHLYYNEQGLVSKSIDPLGNVTLNTYDADYDLTKVTNTLGEFESYTYNAVGEVTSSTDFLGNTTYFAYAGPFNKLSQMTDAKGNKTGYAYSSTGNLLTTTFADGSSQTSSYDPEGNALSFLNANKQPINYTYNAAGQVLKESFSDGTSYTYTYDAYGNLKTAVDVTGTTTFGYDPVTQLMTSVSYPNGTGLTFSYNAAGQRSKSVDQTGFTVNYTYDSAGRLNQLTDGSGNTIVIYIYDANGRLSLKTNGNGTYTTYRYDADGNLMHLINYAPSGAVNSRFDYIYNSVGLVTSEATLDGTWIYTYDADGQLVHAVFASTNSSVQDQDMAYTYDSMGNRLTSIINGLTTSYISNIINEYTSVGGTNYTYDGDGNLTFDGTNTYTYNSLNELISINGSTGTTSSTFNALGVMLSSSSGGQVTEYLNDPTGFGSISATFTGTGQLLAHDFNGLSLVGENTPGGIYYFDFDATGSTAGITNYAGTYVNSYLYLPFGASLFSQQSVGMEFQYSGALGSLQGGGGLYTMGVRQYTTSLGRFLEPDPSNLSGGGIAFEFAGNNPINAADPTGLFTLDLGVTIGVEWAPFLCGPNGVTFGIQIGEDGVYGYAGAGFTTPGLSWSVTGGPGSPSEGGSTQLQGAVGIVGGLAGSVSFPDDGGDPSYEGGAGEGIGSGARVTGVGLFHINTVRLFKWQDLSDLFDSLIDPSPPGGNIGYDGDDDDADSEDPNSIMGPGGFGVSNFISSAQTIYPYQIEFENSPTASSPAQTVTITASIDPNLDWSTFQLTGVAWGDTILSIPAGSQFYETSVPMTYDGQTFKVLVQAGIHLATGEVYATFQSLNPLTNLPPDVLAGFLPPENGTGRGTGYISYMIQPKASLPTGTQIRSIATITFDSNTPITTDQVDDTNPSKGTDRPKRHW